MAKGYVLANLFPKFANYLHPYNCACKGTLRKRIASGHSVTYKSPCNYKIASSQLVKQDGGLTNIEKDVVLARVGNIACEMFANNTVPVRRIFAIEVLLYEFRDLLLSVRLIKGQVNLLLNVLLHVLCHLTDNPLNISFCHLSLLI